MNKYNLRQPLQRMIVKTDESLEYWMLKLLLEEINVKEAFNISSDEKSLKYLHKDTGNKFKIFHKDKKSANIDQAEIKNILASFVESLEEKDTGRRFKLY